MGFRFILGLGIVVRVSVAITSMTFNIGTVLWHHWTDGDGRLHFSGCFPETWLLKQIVHNTCVFFENETIFSKP